MATSDRRIRSCSGGLGCDEFRGVTHTGRRQVLQAGAAGLLGITVPDLWRGRLLASETASAALPGFGRAKSCIFFFMWGGPSQLETFDPKPDAPVEVRGEFRPIDTVVPGIQISEHFERLARWTDKVAIVRSLNHTDPAHLSSAHCTLTGQLAPVLNSDAEPPSERDSPHVGSVLAKLRPPTSSGMPPFVTMPWLTMHPAAPGGRAPGQNGGWLGSQYDPFLVTGDPNEKGWAVPALALSDGLTIDRLNHRAQLVKFIDEHRRTFDQLGAAAEMSEHQRRAFGLLASPEVRAAFDLGTESDETRDRYGRHIHGQCALLARRMAERGVPLVSVNWHHDGRNFWDTHGDNFRRLKNDLIPPADRALSALLDDLQSRGLLDETLIVWVGEFGRRPQISKENAGRDHWPFCYNGLLAGGGIRGGQVYGRSDRDAAHPAENPVSPQDFGATVLHALGVDEGLVLHDRQSRPHRVYGGKPILPLFDG